MAASTTVSLLSDMSSMASTTLTSWDQGSLMWTMIFGFIVAFILAFAVGANDVANSFGTTVGANVLTLRTACILASIFETVGAVLLGAKVGETIRKGIIDVTIYNGTEYGRELLMVGEVSAMTGAAIWQLIATLCGLPVSGTHSIVGACIGFSLVAVGATGVNWRQLGFIVASWFVSPVLSGFLSVSLYLFINHFILEKNNPMKNGLQFLPFFYAFTLGINGFSILYSGAPLLGLDGLPLWGIGLITCGIMIITGLVVHFFLVPRLRVKALKEMADAETGQELHQIQRATDTSSDAEQSTNMKKNRSDSGRLNDSGYQTPCDSRRKTNIILNTEIGLDEEDDDAFADKSATGRNLLQYDKELDTPPSACTKGEHADEMLKLDTKPIDCSSSYDGGDSDSAFDDDDVKKTLKKNGRESISKSDSSSPNDEEDEVEDPPSVRRIFSFLQILTACFGSFAHGGNDVSNAIGPLIALWLIFHSGNVVQKAATPWYLLLYGGVGIIAGLWTLGRRVIKTIGRDLTKITPSRGFCIELMTALTVLIASNVGIPVSTTHCKVGSVVSIGWVRSRSAVKWSMVRNIALAWFVTVPVSGLISAGVMYLLMNVAL